MKRFLPLSCLALLVAACSSIPAGPSRETTASTPVAAADDGTVSSKAITIERIRLRRAGGADLATGLINGQIIDVPVNTNLDVWAEIRRLETDRARLVVDWGNGNSDFTGCGSCRLENLYREEGRYTVKVSVIDLNAPTGSEVITALTVTLNVIDFARLGALTCAGVSTNFDSFPIAPLSPVLTGSGFTITGNSQGRVFPVVFPYAMSSGRNYRPRGPMTIEFASDKNFFSIAFHHTNLIPPQNPIYYKVYDAAGVEVMSGSTAAGVTGPAIGPGGPIPTVEGTLGLSGRTFRKVVITADPPGQYLILFFDNLQADCR